MSIQDPPFNNPSGTGVSGTPSSDSSPSTETRSWEQPREDGTLPATDAAKLREAGDTIRSDFNSAFETAKNDLRSLADNAKRDFAAAKDEAVNQFQTLRGQAADNAQAIGSQASGQYENLKSQAQDQIQSLKGEAQSQIGEAADKARNFAGEQVSQLTSQARSFASQQKDLAAQQITGVVDAVSRVANELQQNQGSAAVAGYAQDIAGSLRSLADNIQNKSVDELFGLVQDFGKRQPLAFLGIAALTGFAASRFILASRRRSERPEFASGAYGKDRSFDDEVLSRQGYRPGRTAVELDRSNAGLDESDLTARGVGDNGRI